MSMIMVAKKLNGTNTSGSVNASIDALWNVIDAKYKTHHVSGKDYWVGIVPSKTGDMTAAGKYFTKVDMFRMDAHAPQDVAHELEVYESCLTNGIEMGNGALVKAMNSMGVTFELFERSKVL